MFKSETKLFLKSINLRSEDDNKRIAVLRFFLTPATYELASEVSPNVADRLFRKNGNMYEPVLEMGRTEFLIQIPSQSMSYRRHPDYVGHQVHIPDVSIENLSAQKVIPGDPNFSLIFDASFEILDKTIVTDLVDLLHENFYVTFAPMQPGLFGQEGEWDDLLCRLCSAPNPEWGVEGSKKPKLAYCNKCKDQKMDDENLIRIADHSRAAAAAEDNDGSEESKPTDPLLAGDDINRRASQRQRGKRVH